MKILKILLIFFSGNVEFGHNGLSYSDSLYRNSKRVEILNTGCQLAPEKISDLDFSSLNEIHFNTTHRLGIDRSFMGRNSRELKDQGKQLEKFQLVDLFRIKQEMIINKLFSPTISRDDAVCQLRPVAYGANQRCLRSWPIRNLASL